MAITNQELDSIADLLGGVYDKEPAEQQEAWAALAKMFREGPMPLGIRVWLANMCDPDMRDTFRLRLALKREPGASKKINEKRVAAVVWHRVMIGDKKEAAIKHAADTLRVSFSTAEKAFAKWDQWFDKHASKLRSLTDTEDKS
jgi:hypothetical protein